MGGGCIKAVVLNSFEKLDFYYQESVSFCYVYWLEFEILLHSDDLYAMIKMKNWQSEGGMEHKESLPWIVFKLADGLYTFNTKYVNSILMLEDRVSPLPEAPNYFRGVINIRGEVYPLLDLRRLFRMSGLSDDCHEFTNAMDKKERELTEWFDELVRCINTGEPFYRSTDPKESKFGKWLFHFKASNPALDLQVRKMDEPYTRLAETATKLLSAHKSENHELVNTLLTDLTENQFPDFIKLMQEVKNAFRSVYREMVVIAENEENTLAFVVDEVVTVDNLEIVTEKSAMDRFYDSKHVRGIAKSEKVPGEIIVLDENMIISNRSVLKEINEA